MNNFDSSFNINFSGMGQQPNQQNINADNFLQNLFQSNNVEFMPQLEMMPTTKSNDFYENLVGKISENELSTLSSVLRKGIESDIESRSQWEQRLANGIKQLGLVADNNGANTNNDASTNLFSSTFIQAVLTSLAQICSVLLPPAGPARMKIMNPIKDDKQLKDLSKKSNEVSSFMNNMLTDFSPEYYPETEQAFFWAAMYGSCFKKVYFDESLCRPVSPLIKPQDLILNSNAITLISAPRITHRFYLTAKELKLRQMTGMYADVPISSYKNYDDNPVEDILNRVAGINKSTYDDDHTSLYQMYETRVDYCIPSIQDTSCFPCPYIVTLEKESGAVISVRRNWRQNDPYFKRLNDIVRYPFFHGLGIYGLGYIHIMGTNAEAATELLRQLIFSGKMSNFPAFIRAKGMRMDDSNIRLQPGESAEIDCGNKSVQDCLMKVPFGEPSPALKQMKDDLEDNILKSMNAMNTVFSDMNPNAPVGTTLALIEQASKMETSIIKRLHKGISEELNLIFQLTVHNFEKMQIAFANENKFFPIQKEDLVNDFQILPVSDPNLSTSAHLLIQSEALSSLYSQFPTLINPRPVVELKLRALKVENVEQFLIIEEDVLPRNPLTENMDLINGKPVKAGIEQNQQAHILTHQGLLTNPAIMQDPTKQAAVTAHIQEHYAFDYQIKMQQLMQGQQVLNPEQDQDINMQNQVAEMAAQATQTLIQEQQQAIQGNQPQQLDPNQVLMADIEAKKEAGEQKMQVELLKAETDKYKADLDFEAKQRDLNLREKEMNQKYHLEASDQEYQQNLQEREHLMERLNQDNEMIKFQVSEIINKLENLHNKDMENQQKLMQTQSENMQNE